MNKVFLLVIIACISLKAAAQQRYTDTAYFHDNEISKAGVLNEKDSTWTVYHYYNSDYGKKKLRTIERFAKDGYTKNGEETGYQHTGLVAYTINWKNGVAQGPFIIYYPDGKVKTRGNFYNHFKSGIWRQYDSLGNHISSIDFKLTSADSNYVFQNKWNDKFKFEMVSITYGEIANPHFPSHLYYVKYEFPVFVPAKQVKIKETEKL